MSCSDGSCGDTASCPRCKAILGYLEQAIGQLPPDVLRVVGQAMEENLGGEPGKTVNANFDDIADVEEEKRNGKNNKK